MERFLICLLPFIIYSLSIFSSFAQENTREQDITIPNVIGPSPEVSALAKYVEMPVDYSTGINQIDIPIHTIKEGTLELPISLNYYAGGIRVAEEASSVGLGWSLMAGGVIGRMVKGKPDDENGSGFMFNEFSVAHVDNLNIYELSNYFDVVDTEPDIFFFNFMGYSGRFQFIKGSNGSGYFKQLKDSNLIIEYDINGRYEIDRFIVTTPDGTKYYFGNNKDFSRNAIEKTSTFYHHFPTQPSVIKFTNTAWSLLEIESATDDKIELYYKYHYESDAVLESQSILNKYPAVSFASCNNNPSDNPSLSHTISENNRDRPTLESIKSTYHSIRFKYDAVASREDLYGSFRLQKIIIEDRQNNTDIKEYELDHGYFTSSIYDSENFLNIPYAKERTKRLKLLSVQERGLLNNRMKELPPYIFEYNQGTLPHKFSFAQDYWGFYNGKIDNPHLLPHVMIDNTILHHNHGNAERSVNPTKTQAATLSKITYPTGGYTLYEYENNKISTYNRPDASRYSLRNVIKPISKYFLKIRENEHPLLPNSYTYTFEIKENIIGNVKFDIITVTGEGCTDLLTNFACDFFISMKGLDNNYSSGIFSSRSFSENLEPGTYEITAEGTFSGNPYVPNIDFHVEINWEEEDVEFIGNPYELVSGGLRIKTIEKYDRQETLLLKKSYEYTRKTTQSEENTSGLNLTSSGNMAWWPQYHFTGYQYTSAPCCLTSNHTLISANSQRPLFNYKGGNVIYEKVIEYTDNISDKLGNINSFKTEYFFDFVNGVNSPGNDLLGVFHEEMYSDPLRGNLIKKESYENIFNTYKLLSEETYIYEDLITHYPDFGVMVIPGQEYGGLGGCTLPITRYMAYNQRSIVHRLKASSKIDYFSTSEIAQTTEYSYNNISNKTLVSREKTNYYENGNNLKTVEIQFQYPFDFVHEVEMQNLVAQNRIQEPVKIITKINGTTSKTVNTIYETSARTSNITLPITLQVGKGGDTSLEDRIHYNKYDEKGNFLEVLKDKGTKTSYIWGYHDRYPVVKIENKAYNDIPSQLISNIKNASGNDSDAQLRSAIHALRTNSALANSMLTGYIYAPLIGITSIIDPKGDESFYQYDALGRLERITNKQGHVVEEFEYHYSGQ